MVGDTSFDELSGIGIPEIVLNIVSCYGFVHYKNSTLILTCRSKLVLYHLSKGFLIFEQAYQALKNVTLRVQNRINDINMFDCDYIVSCSTAITSVLNTLNNIYLGGPIWDEFTSEYYNDKNDTFGMLFRKYTAISVDNVYLPFMVNE